MHTTLHYLLKNARHNLHKHPQYWVMTWNTLLMHTSSTFSSLCLTPFLFSLVHTYYNIYTHTLRGDQSWG